MTDGTNDELYLAGVARKLHERGTTLFTHADVSEITSLQVRSARNFVASLVHRGVATRLKPGLFILVPFELGYERDYLGNPYVVARELVGSADYYVSHASAMDLHRMVTQPQLVVYTTTTKAIRPRDVLGTEFRFVRCKPEHLFGTAGHWVTKSEQVQVSDLERLQQKLTAAYAVLDPLLPDEGKFVARWRLRLNVDRDEIVSVART